MITKSETIYKKVINELYQKFKLKEFTPQQFKKVAYGYGTNYNVILHACIMCDLAIRVGINYKLLKKPTLKKIEEVHKYHQVYRSMVGKKHYEKKKLTLEEKLNEMTEMTKQLREKVDSLELRLKRFMGEK